MIGTRRGAGEVESGRNLRWFLEKEGGAHVLGSLGRSERTRGEGTVVPGIGDVACYPTRVAGLFEQNCGTASRCLTTTHNAMDDPTTSDSPRGLPQPSPPTAKGGVPVYVMLPLDTVSREGTLRSVHALEPRLVALKDAGVEGVMIDVWWGIVERCGPGRYDWSAYSTLMELLKRLGLKLHVVLSFHACGANRDDDYHVSLPSWVESAVQRDADGLLFKDRAGTSSDEYLSLWADGAPMPMIAGNGDDDDEVHLAQSTPLHPPRTPLECYRDLMKAFSERFNRELNGTDKLITEVLIGCGPCGELRYPAYAANRGWVFPGVGEFQCYDRRALESLANAANSVGRPEWGKGGPHDAGSYNSRPDETGFFANGRGVFGSNQKQAGQFGGTPGNSGAPSSTSSLFTSRSMMLPTTLAPDSPVAGGAPNPDGALFEGVTTQDHFHRAAHHRADGRTRSLDDLVSHGDAPNGRWDGEYGKFFLSWYSNELVAHGERVMRCANEAFGSCDARVALKCAGIHWWYNTRSHAAELTTGYYNVQGGCESFGSESAPALTNSVENFGNRRASMDWVPGREGGVLSSSSSFLSREGGVGVNSIFKPLHRNANAGSHGSVSSLACDQGAPTTGYDRIMAMAKACGASVTFTCAEMSDREHDPKHMCGPEGLMRRVVGCASRHGVPVAAENALYRCDAVAFRQMVRNCKRGVAPASAEDATNQMTSFTFLRMCDSLFEPNNFLEFVAFVKDLTGGAGEWSP